MNYVLKFLSNEYEVLKIEADIKAKVHAEMDRSSRQGLQNPCTLLKNITGKILVIGSHIDQPMA